MLAAASPAAHRPPTPNPTATAAAPTVWFAPDLPEDFLQAVTLPTSWVVSQDAAQAGVTVTTASNGKLAAQWHYVLAAPFPTISDHIKLNDLKTAWKSGHSDNDEFKRLIISYNTFLQFKRLWGDPDPGFVEISSDGHDLQQRCWDEKNTWSIIPFGGLNPRWKVIQVDNLSPIQQPFTPDDYPLQIKIFIQSGPNHIKPQENAALIHSIPPSNRLDENFTSLTMTGVTALVRATAAFMEYKGMTYPGQDVRELLRAADINVINNEVAFAKDCPTPSGNATSTQLKFCSKPKYIELLEDIGTDMIDMGGDHLSDWGDQAFMDTLELYRQKGWLVFGGGENIEKARAPIFVENNKNRFAFLSCNAKAPGYAKAAANSPGAVHCDMAFLQQQVQTLSAQGYLVLANIQHQEVSSYKPIPEMEEDLRSLSAAGAVIVTGSQAHQPQTMEFYKNRFIHYGLGNLFFDQYYIGFPNRQAFIDRHIFYNGRHINTELITIMFIDFARPRFMTVEERTALLTLIFKESNWNPELEKK